MLGLIPRIQPSSSSAASWYDWMVADKPDHDNDPRFRHALNTRQCVWRKSFGPPCQATTISASAGTRSLITVPKSRTSGVNVRPGRLSTCTDDVAATLHDAGQLGEDAPDACQVRVVAGTRRIALAQRIPFVVARHVRRRRHAEVHLGKAERGKLAAVAVPQVGPMLRAGPPPTAWRRSSRSTPKGMRRISSATNRVVPSPANGSNTRSPGLVNSFRKSRTSDFRVLDVVALERRRLALQRVGKRDELLVDQAMSPRREVRTDHRRNAQAMQVATGIATGCRNALPMALTGRSVAAEIWAAIHPTTRSTRASLAPADAAPRQPVPMRGRAHPAAVAAPTFGRSWRSARR